MNENKNQDQPEKDFSMDSMDFMDMEDFFQKHYIRTRKDGAITHGFSDAFEQPESTDILINDKGGRHFRLILSNTNNVNSINDTNNIDSTNDTNSDTNSETNNEQILTHENPWELMINEQGIPLLKWDSNNKKIINRTEKEIQADINALPAPEPVIPIEERIKHLEAHQEYVDKILEVIIGTMPQQAQVQITQIVQTLRNQNQNHGVGEAELAQKAVHNE